MWETRRGVSKTKKREPNRANAPTTWKHHSGNHFSSLPRKDLTVKTDYSRQYLLALSAPAFRYLVQWELEPSTKQEAHSFRHQQDLPFSGGFSWLFSKTLLHSICLTSSYWVFWSHHHCHQIMPPDPQHWEQALPGTILVPAMFPHPEFLGVTL